MKEPTTGPLAESATTPGQTGARREYRCRNEKQKTGKIEEPIYDFFDHAAVQRHHKGIVNAADVANSRNDQRTVSIRKKEKVVDQTQNQAGQNAVD